MKGIFIFASAALFFALGWYFGSESPLLSALWGAAGTAALLYWPRRSLLQVLSLCWLCILLYAVAAICTTPREVGYMPGGITMAVLFAVPFLMVLVPIVVIFFRAAYRDHMRTVLEEAVLAATDPLVGPESGAMEKALLLLNKGTCADFIPDAMVERDELVFEAVDTPDSEAVQNAIQLIPLLGKAGAYISEDALKSARYNCPPSIQEALSKLPIEK